jgi:predicted Zn-dependent protease
LSSQIPDWGLSVVSTYRLTERLPDFGDARLLATRRFTIQLFSAIGNGLGLVRPTSAHCPLAYVNGVEAFTRKSHRLCESTRVQLRERVSQFTDAPVQFDTVRLARLEEAERRFLFARE